MNRNVFFTLLMLGAIFTFSSCKKDYLVNVSGSLTGVVSDFVTNQPVSGVKVTVVINDKTEMVDSTNSAGYYTITGLPAGNYIVKFSKAGFASMKSTVYVESPNVTEKTTSGSRDTYAYGTTLNQVMSQTIGKVSGIVTFNGANVKNAKVILAFNDSYVNIEPGQADLYTTTSNDNGEYSFNNVPLGFRFTVTAYTSAASGSSTVNQLYYPQSIDPSIVDVDLSVTSIRLTNFTGKGSAAGGSPSLETGLRVDTTATSFTLTFSQPIDQTITTNKGEGVHLYTYDAISGTNREVLTSYTINGSTVTVTLANGAALVSYKYYWFVYSVYATESNYDAGSYYNYYGFYTKEQHATIANTAPVITGVNMTTPANSVITVNSVPAVSGGVKPNAVVNFDVYIKPAGNENALEYKYISTKSISGTSTRSITLDLSKADYAKASIYVVPWVIGFDGIKVQGTPSLAYSW